MRCINRFSLVVGLAGIDSRTQHAEHVEPGSAAVIDAVPSPYLVIHSQGKKDVGLQSALAAAKSFGRHAHYRVRIQIELDRLADDGRIAGEMVLPQAVAEYRDRRAPALVGPRRNQGSAKIWPHAQHFEILGAGQRAVNALRLGRSGDRDVVVVIADQAGQGFGVGAQIDEIRIRERGGRMLAALAALDREHPVNVLCRRNGIK